MLFWINWPLERKREKKEKEHDLLEFTGVLILFWMPVIKSEYKVIPAADPAWNC